MCVCVCVYSVSSPIRHTCSVQVVSRNSHLNTFCSVSFSKHLFGYKVMCFNQDSFDKTCTILLTNHVRYICAL